MPASAVLAPVVALPALRPGPVRLVMSGRGCPACGDALCKDPGACLLELSAHFWGDCDWCEGSGWSDDDVYAL
jgi:hypothetical protein